MFISTHVGVSGQQPSGRGRDRRTHAASRRARRRTPSSPEDARKYYGALKTQSEKEVEKQYPGINTIIRPGLIVGPLDKSDRFTYWPVRIDKGGEVLAPGNPTDPVQFIDSRDLAEWMIRMAEAACSAHTTPPARDARSR